MKRKIYPAIGIVVVAASLLAVNALTESRLVSNFALILIIAGMLFGVWLGKISERQTE